MTRKKFDNTYTDRDQFWLDADVKPRHYKSAKSCIEYLILNYMLFEYKPNAEQNGTIQEATKRIMKKARLKDCFQVVQKQFLENMDEEDHKNNGIIFYETLLWLKEKKAQFNSLKVAVLIYIDIGKYGYLFKDLERIL